MQRPSRSNHRQQKHPFRVECRRGTTFMYCATPMHTTLHANNLPAEPLKCRRTSGTAVKSSPQKTSAPAHVLCDRLRPSKKCRLNSFRSTTQNHQQISAECRHRTEVTRHCECSRANAKHQPHKLPVSPFVVAKFSAPPDHANETALPCTAIAQVAQKAPADWLLDF